MYVKWSQETSIYIVKVFMTKAFFKSMSWCTKVLRWSQTDLAKHTGDNTSNQKRPNQIWHSPSTTDLLPFLFLFLSFLQFLQVLLGKFNDVRSLLLRGQRRGGESAGSSVERLAIGGTRQILPQMLINRFALQEFGSESEMQGQNQEEDTNEPGPKCHDF